MNKQDRKRVVLPLEDEFERLGRLLSEHEKRQNPRVVKKLSKLRQKLIALREFCAPKRLKPIGEY